MLSLAGECEIWGVDISARHIVWCQENLNPPFNFATVTTHPHLPFEDRYFNFIYCFSVFTNIDDLTDAWLLEIKRIMRPNGRAYITINDKYTQDLIINQIDRVPYADEFRRKVLSYEQKMCLSDSDYYMFSINPGGPEAIVFYDIDHLLPRKYTELLHAEWNLVLSCRACNGLKSNFDPRGSLIPTAANRESFLTNARAYISRKRDEATKHFELEKALLRSTHREVPTISPEGAIAEEAVQGQ